MPLQELMVKKAKVEELKEENLTVSFLRIPMWIIAALTLILSYKSPKYQYTLFHVFAIVEGKGLNTNFLKASQKQF